MARGNRARKMFEVTQKAKGRSRKEKISHNRRETEKHGRGRGLTLSHKLHLRKGTQ